MLKKYKILRNPTDNDLNRYGEQGWHIVGCVPDTHTRYHGFLETSIVIVMEKEYSL